MSNLCVCVYVSVVITEHKKLQLILENYKNAEVEMSCLPVNVGVFPLYLSAHFLTMVN